MSNKISVCIPTYEMHGKGVLYLDFIIQSLTQQTYKNFEVVISDHSKDDAIENYCKTITNMPLKYLRNTEKRGCASANINNAVRHAEGDIIKPMFQDDFLCGIQSLEIINSVIENNPFKWGAAGFCHVNDVNDLKTDIPNTYQIPYWNNNLALGTNTIGCPSVIYYRNDVNKPYFDENIFWLMDTEFYHQLKLSLGDPGFISYILTAVRIWDNSVTYSIDEETKRKEEIYVKEKWELS